jgi:tetratricopeptide (TPR) repeat protein
LQGDLAGAADLFRQSLKLRKEIGDKGGEAESLNNLAELLAEQGDVTAAKAAFNESFRLHQEGGQKGASTYQLNGLGKLLLNSGDLAGATQRLEQSQAIAREIEEKPLLSAALAGLGDVYLQQGRLGDARKAFEQALAIDKELGYREEADEISLGLAEVDIEDGRPADAQVLIQLALKGFRNGRLSDNEISGHTLLARAMLAQAQLNDARKQIELGRELAAKSQNRLVVLACKITEARVLVASGNLPAAFALLDSALAEAKKSALVRYELEARLAWAEMEVKSGKEVGRSNLAALRNDARAKGFELIANKAAAL